MSLPLRRLLGCLFAALALGGCEYLGTDVATRIRAALLAARTELDKSATDTLTIILKPNHWPDSCGDAAGYRVTLSPYKGNKQVAVGDINIQCQGKRSFYTGIGAEGLTVAREMAVEKKAADAIRITLRKVKGGVEVIALE